MACSAACCDKSRDKGLARIGEHVVVIADFVAVKSAETGAWIAIVGVLAGIVMPGIN
jgi:hypothetical protein